MTASRRNPSRVLPAILALAAVCSAPLIFAAPPGPPHGPPPPPRVGPGPTSKPTTGPTSKPTGPTSRPTTKPDNQTDDDANTPPHRRPVGRRPGQLRHQRLVRRPKPFGHFEVERRPRSRRLSPTQRRSNINSPKQNRPGCLFNSRGGFYFCSQNYYSSFSLNFASTLRSSSVLVSPFTSCPLATSFSNRRIIFPLRVLGSESVKRI